MQPPGSAVEPSSPRQERAKALELVNLLLFTALEHPCVMVGYVAPGSDQVTAFMDEDGATYLGMQRVAGTELASLQGLLSLEKSARLELVRKLGMGLLFFEQCGLEHHDAHSRNILVDAAWDPIIIDLGSVAQKSQREGTSDVSLFYDNVQLVFPKSEVDPSQSMDGLEGDDADILRLAKHAYRAVSRAEKLTSMRSICVTLLGASPYLEVEVGDANTTQVLPSLSRHTQMGTVYSFRPDLALDPRTAGVQSYHDAATSQARSSDESMYESLQRVQAASEANRQAASRQGPS
ncbi:hypothetical protein WJX73_006648 [Symbiochloris irregularis]|uniref:Protein kinase domain-containing protein n=1 Tax=Symbiochloris irregularis TaxID=706552 RepID=A0AAW1NQP0_9CHLO